MRLLLLPTLLAYCLYGVTDTAPSMRMHAGPAVFDPMRSPLLAVAETPELATVDREFEYPADFQLDEPFVVAVDARERLLLPLAPIRDKLFSNAEANPAIGFEFSTCTGKIMSRILMVDGHFQQFSSADYQCATLTKSMDPRMNLCPIVHSDRNVSMHKDPTNVKGFVLHAHFAQSAEVVAVLRSTKRNGAFSKAFSVAGGPEEAAAARRLNVSFSTRTTQLAFNTAQTWEPTAAATVNQTCDGCEYTLYAEMVPPLNSSNVPPEHPPPPQCVSRSSSVAYVLPATSSAVSQRVTLSTQFADAFSTSGDYRFVLVAALPASTNKERRALISYAPSRVSVTAPTHFVSHLLVILIVVAIVAFLFTVAVKSELPQRLMGTRANDETHDDESVRLLAQAIANQDAEDASGREDDDHGDEERKSESLLDVIRKTKAEQETAKSSPRHTAPQGAQLDGYHEIN